MIVAEQRRLVAVGDIHGCLGKLEELLQRIPINWDRDVLIFLGDYIDRGPDSKGVLDLLISLRELYGEHVIFLKGNHEAMLLDYIKGFDRSFFLVNGGMATLASYGVEPDALDGFELPLEHLRFLEQLVLFHEAEDYFFVHAGVRPGVPLANQLPEDMLWIRGEFIDSKYDWGKRIVFGHTVFSLPLIEENKIGIDTGAVYGGRLTAVILPEVDFVFV